MASTNPTNPKSRKKKGASSDKESFLFAESVSDLKITKHTERSLRDELFNKFDPKEVVDAYEAQLGIRKQVNESGKKQKHRVKNIILNLGTEEDKTLMNKLFNDSKYKVIYFRDNWTVHGDYKAFVMYTEAVDEDAEENEEDTEENSE